MYMQEQLVRELSPPESFSPPSRSSQIEGELVPSTITVAQLQTQPQSELIDVRSPSEFAAGHIPGAINVPMD